MYATVNDITARFGETEIIRLSQPEDRGASAVDESKVNLALADASGLIDTYLRNHYALPVTAPYPPELVRACCVLARHDLAQGARIDPTEQMVKDRAEIVSWLGKVASNHVSLDIARANAAGNPSSGPGARFSDREPAFSDKQLRGW